MNIPLIINVLVFVALLILLAKLGAKGWSLSKKVLLGLVLVWHMASLSIWCTVLITKH